MSRDRRYRELDDEIAESRYIARKAGWSAGRWILTITIGVMLLGGLVWGVQVLVAGTKGAGDVHIATEDAKNRIGAQQEFHTMFNNIKAYDDNINTTAVTLATATGDDKNHWQSVLVGQQNVCQSAVGQYNARTDHVTRAKWLDTTLPYKIDGSNLETDCKPDVVPTPAAS